MAHDVTFTIPARSLGKEDVEFEVRNEGELIGVLKISKGAVVWRPKSYSYEYKLRWRQFDAVMQENGTRQ
jgi:hypothetical protein